MSAEPAKTETAPIELDDATKKVIEDFDAYALQRAKQLIKYEPSQGFEPVLSMLERAFCLGYKAGVIDAGQAQRQHQAATEPAAAPPAAPPVSLISAEVAEAQRRSGDEFSRFFTGLGYVVGWDGRWGTPERWYEICEDGAIVCQVQATVPLAEFLADLPHLVEGKPGVGPTDYWCACEDAAKLRALWDRVRAASEAAGSDRP